MTDHLYEVESGYILPTREKYFGDFDANGQRIGKGYQTWEIRHEQKYEGNFLQDNLHGDGEYLNLNGPESFLYEGTFFVNDFEGYSNITYMNGDFFEGLFRHNRRFGPGVYTYANGTQNVGLWNGTQLMRLSCVVLGEWVPKLARTSSAKVKLLKYRKLVPLRQKYEDVAKSILIKLNARPEIVAMSDKLYNPYIRNINSLFFNRKLHDTEFFGEINCTIDVATNSEEIASSASESTVTSILSPLEVVEGILDYLLENVDIIQDFPEEERKNFIYETLLEARRNFQIEYDTVVIKEFLQEFMFELDDLLSRSSDERALIINKRLVRKKLPVTEKPKVDLTVRKVVVSDLLAWNNEEMSVEMLKHVFAHRNKEHTMSFSIGKLLSGNRAKFNAPGELENKCVSFLNYCSSGDANATIKILRENCLNPDLCDARGNSGIIYASARDRWKTIKTLCNIGANLDIVNDEGLTALALCLLRYISIQNDIKDWERAFLRDALVTREEELQLKQWHPHVSLSNMNLSAVSLSESFNPNQEHKFACDHFDMVQEALKHRTSDVDSKSDSDMYEEFKNIEIDTVFKNFQEHYGEYSDVKQEYVLSAKCLSQFKRQLRGADGKPKGNLPDSQFIKENKLKVVFTTIQTLLQEGADPNLSRIPLPALLLAVFCSDLVLFNLILESNADPNVTSQDENLGALHILAALPFTSTNLEMFEFVLNKGADPNLRTNIYHWVEEKEKILSKHEPVEEDLGKTPLHILSMRHDYMNNAETQQEMVKLLIEHGGSLTDRYLGHEPFTLAVLRGNLNLIRYYLDSGFVNPYRKLGENMGNATTILILKRYANVLPFEQCKQVYDLFTEKNVNPLVEMEEYGNAIDFMDWEYKSQTPRIMTKKKTAEKKLNKSEISKSSQYSKKHKQSVELTKNYLLECTKHMLQRHLQYQAFRHLKRFLLQSVDLGDDIMVTLSKFLPIKDLVRVIQLLIHRGFIQPKPIHFYILLKIMELSKKHCKVKEEKSKANRNNSLSPSELIKKFDWTENQVPVYFNMIEPELDMQADKYTVCFYCCKKIEKDLILCPNCGLVYFCCQECNKLSNKEATVHKCNLLFYDSEKKLRDHLLANNLGYPKSKLEAKLQLLDEFLREKYGKDFPGIGGADDMGAGDFIFDQLGSALFEQLLEKDPDLLAKMENSLKQVGLDNLEESLLKPKQVGASGDGKPEDDTDELSLDSQGRPKKKKDKAGSKGSEESLSDRKSKRDKKEGGKKSGSHRDKSKFSESIEKRRKKGGKGSDKASSKSSGSRKSGSKSKGRSDKSKIETIYQRSRSKGKYSRGDKSSKYAVYRQDISRSDYSRSRKDQYEQEQQRLREQYKEKTGQFGVMGNLKECINLFGKMGKDYWQFHSLPHKCQFFIEKLSELFPDIDFSLLFWPYVCYVDGQLYYRFLEERPIFLETYSNV